jgi:hypothetical protein
MRPCVLYSVASICLQQFVSGIKKSIRRVVGPEYLALAANGEGWKLEEEESPSTLKLTPRIFRGHVLAEF